MNVEKGSSRREQHRDELGSHGRNHQRALEAVDEAQEASDERRDNTTLETLDLFREKRDELTDKLTRLQAVLDHTLKWQTG